MTSPHGKGGPMTVAKDDDLYRPGDVPGTDRAGLPGDLAETTGLDIAALAEGTVDLIKRAGQLGYQAFRIPQATLKLRASVFPLVQLLARDGEVTGEELSEELNRLFTLLYAHPLTDHTRKLTNYLRSQNILPNEGSTENLIRYVVDQAILRSPVDVPPEVVNEFWNFFHQLMSEPELKGLADINLDMVRLLLRTYEPLLVDVINTLKDIRRVNQRKIDELVLRVQVVRDDLTIIRRQIKAIRYVKPFFQTAPDDYHTQAQIVAKMVREFGPFFIKMAQVAAANSDFLPEEISKELLVFQQDVPPMTGEEAVEAIRQSFGRNPYELYFGFDSDNPLKSGSIGCVYLAKKPMLVDGRETLVPVIVKVGRHNLDREFVLGKATIGLTLLSSQYWAPHTKLAPFLEAMMKQIDEFVVGFQRELDFEAEAAIQRRFAERSKNSRIWKVPKVYSATRRVIEMEYIADAVSIHKAAARFAPRTRATFNRKVARRFLYTLMTHILIYQEVHGDLHPGNILVNKDAQLFLIDWGNTVTLEGKIKPLWDYIVGAFSADVALLTDALINISTEPEANRERRDEIFDNLQKTLDKKGIEPLGRMFILDLYKEGQEGWIKRTGALIHLMSNSQQIGLVVRSEYLHLSRSLVALLGSFAGLYQDLPKYLMMIDIMRVVNRFPTRLVQDWVGATRHDIERQVWKTIFKLAQSEKARRVERTRREQFGLPAADR